MGLKFGIFEGFRWVRSSIFVDKPGFRNVENSVFPDLGPGFGPFLAKHVQSSIFLEGFETVHSSVLVDQT